MQNENLTQTTAPKEAMEKTDKEKAEEIFQRTMRGDLFVEIGKSFGITPMRARSIAERTWRQNHPEHYKKRRGDIGRLRKNPIMEAESEELGAESGE